MHEVSNHRQWIMVKYYATKSVNFYFLRQSYKKQEGYSIELWLIYLLETPLRTVTYSRVGGTQLNNAGRNIAHCKRYVYANASHNTIYWANMCDLPI